MQGWFEWDERERRATLAGRSIDFVDVQRMFEGRVEERRDTRRDYSEQRCIAVGELDGDITYGFVQNLIFSSSRSGVQVMSVLVVTGGSRGIGAAVCRKATAKGWACCVNYARDERGARSVVLEITNSGGNAIAVQADVADPAQVEAMFIEVDQKLGPAGL